jgi:hypothetical protein
VLEKNIIATVPQVGQVYGYEHFQEMPHQRANLSFAIQGELRRFFDAMRFPRAAGGMRVCFRAVSLGWGGNTAA